MKSKQLYQAALLIGLSLNIFSQPLLAQGTGQPEKAKAIGLEIEADPLAYLLRGYSLHVAYTFQQHFRASIGVYGIAQPDFFLSNDAFEIFTSGYDLKADYLFGQVKGFFVGAQMTYGRDRIGLKEGQGTEDHWGFSYGLRTGYRIMLGKAENGHKGLYIVPWFALMYSPGAETIQMGQEQLEQTSWIPFPTVHLGWRF